MLKEINASLPICISILEKTLTDTEVDYIINDIVKSISQLDDVEVPGYEYKKL